MNATRLALVGILALGLAFVAQAQDKEAKKDDSVKAKLIGTWEVESGKGLPKGAKVQFAKDGKVLITHKRDDEERKVEGTYKVDGTTIKITTKRDDKERTQEIKVIKVDDKQLVVEGPKEETLTFKKVGKTREKDKK
jgi:uncharacterized protein (TIGR03066 family)